MKKHQKHLETRVWRTLFAGNVCMGGSIKLESHYHCAGSPGFKADEWPVVSLDFGLPANREDLSRKLMSEITATIKKFIADNQLGDTDFSVELGE